MTDLVTFVPAALLSLGLVFTPWVRSRVTVPDSSRNLRRARPDSLVSLGLSVAAFLAVLITLAPFVEGMLPSWLTLGSDPFAFRWHDFSRELLFGSVALAVVAFALIVARRTPRSPVPPAGPRGWRTYASGRGVATLALVFAAFILVTIFAGSVSSPDDDGRHTLFVIESGGDFWGASGRFYGWAYGVPAAIAATALVGVTAFTLQANAARAFLEPQSVEWETASRRAIATRILWFSIGVLVYVLGLCLLRIGGAAGAQLSAPGYTWGTSLATLETVLTWGGRITRGLGMALLLLVGLTHRTGRASRADRTNPTDRTDSAGRADQADRTNPTNRTDSADSADSAGRTDRADRTGRADRADRTDRTNRTDRTDRAGQADRTDRAGRTDSAGRADRVGGYGGSGGHGNE